MTEHPPSMKLIGQLLIVVSLVAGALSAATAYHAWLDLPDDQLVGLTLNAGAGVQINNKGQEEPLLKQGHKLTAEDLKRLRQPQPTSSGKTVKISAVRVKEFSFARWQHKWGLTAFVASMIGMVGGSLLTRRASRRKKAAEPGAEEHHAAAAPRTALLALEAEITQVRKDVQQEADPRARLKIVVDRVGEIQRTLVPAFVDTHGDLIDRLGIGHAAEVMDRFAAAERQINRAWSAASDGDDQEARDCLAEAVAHLEETVERLGAEKPADSV